MPKKRWDREEAPVEEEQPAEQQEQATIFDASSISEQAQKLLKFSTFTPEHRYWLDTGSPLMNAVLGSKKRGIPYGKMLEIRGENHGGKTTLVTLLAGMAQKDGAAVGYIDLEDSRDADWADKLGLSLDKIMLVYPKLMVRKAKKKKGFKKESDSAKEEKATKKTGLPALEHAEEIFAEAEIAMALASRQGAQKQFWFLDSVANIIPELAMEAGAEDQNMRTALERASFLARHLPRWTGLAANYNASIVLINQLRTKQGVVFGSREYSTGGNAMVHTCAVRATVRRVKNGRLRRNGKTVGLVGLITNFKNKAGGGSNQDASCAFMINWSKRPAQYEFMTREEAEALLKG